MHTSVVNRHGQSVITAVTNMDLHDLSRTARTYGLKGFFVVTPVEGQHQLLGRILKHWRSENSKAYHPDRVEALSLVRLVRTFDEVKAQIVEECGREPEVVLPDARPLPGAISYEAYRQELSRRSMKDSPIALVLGTGWGVSEAFYPAVHRILAPVYGPERRESGGRGVLPDGREGYNHLSVRAAGAVILDRIFGARD